MIESLPTIVSVITSVASGIFKDALIDPGIGKRKIENELRKAIETAVSSIEDDFTECFVRDKGRLDESFWRRDEVKTQLWKSLTDKQHPESIPDFDILYDAYCEIYLEHARIERNLFDKTMSEFWTCFLNEVKGSKILSGVYLEKIIFQLDEAVYPAEGRRMIAEYCGVMAKKLEEKIFIRYKPGKREVPDTFSEEEVKNEFLSYKRIRMVLIHEGRERGDEKEQVIEGDSYLDHHKIILVGDGGVGKTRFLQELEKDLATDIASNDQSLDYLPIFIEAREFEKGTTVELEEKLKTRLAEGLNETEYTDGKFKGFIRYLRKYRKLFPLIDAFDQVKSENEPVVFEALASDALFGKCKCFISTRQARQRALEEGIKDRGVDPGLFKKIQLMPFEKHELEAFFKEKYYPRVKPLIDKLDSRENQDINIIQIPMFARLVKIMAVNGEFDSSEAINTNSHSQIMQMFVNFVVNRQAEKDKTTETPQERKAKYSLMLRKIGDLSLKTLENGRIYTFDRDYAMDILGEDSFERHWPLMERIEFIRPFIDYESEECVREQQHRFQHQMFQEFFAAYELRRLYCSRRDKDREEMQSAMENMKYMPEVGQFFSDMIESGTRNPEKDFTYWQGLLEAENNQDWVRTYAHQVRDKLGESKASASLKRLFADENQRLGKSSLTETLIHIPEGRFVMGSYGSEDERPVRYIHLDEYEIDGFPVTNQQFLDFLNECYSGEEDVRDEEDNELIAFSFSRIAPTEFLIKKVFLIKKGYERHPVTGITWYGARAYCEWRGRKEQVGFRLPTEEEWEKSARGGFGRCYPWGNEFDPERCNDNESEIKDTTMIGSYPKGESPYYCSDMAGNVLEWISSYYDEDQNSMVLRGGSWWYNWRAARCAHRYWAVPEDRDTYFGFRCARISK
jgi:formylglycine-generating enzyme required for sulfatase activity